MLFGRSALTIIMMAFIAGLPRSSSDHRGPLADAARADQCRAQLQLNRPAASEISFPSALPTIFVGIRLGLIFALINVVGVEFLINFGGLGQLINDLAERYDLPGTYAASASSSCQRLVFRRRKGPSDG